MRPHRKLTAGLAGAGAAYAGLSVLAVEVITRLGRRVIGVQPAAIWPRHEDVAFPSREPGLGLRGWLFTQPAPRGCLVIASGVWGNRIDRRFGTDRLARGLLERGYDVLLFDFRACGLSQGRRCTFGTGEKLDLLGACDFLRRRGYEPDRTAVLGVSLGGAVLLEAAAELPELGAVVTDSAFADMRRLLRETLRVRAVFWGLLVAARWAYGLRLTLEPAVRVAELPERSILFIHGAEDGLVRLEHAIALRAASRSPGSRLLVMPKAGHAGGYRSDPERYLGELAGFLDAQLEREPTLEAPGRVAPIARRPER